MTSFILDNDFEGLQAGTAPVPIVAIDLSAGVRINQLTGKTFNGDWEAIERQFDIMYREVMEMKESIVNRDYKTLQDDHADVLFTLSGMYGISGMLLGAAVDFERVCANQYDKFDTTAEKAELTRAKYANYGMETVTREVTDPHDGRVWYITFSAKDQLDEKGRMAVEGKWLKSHLYSDPVLTHLPAVVVEKLHIDNL